MSIDRTLRDTMPPLVGASTILVGLLTEPGMGQVSIVMQNLKTSGLEPLLASIVAGGAVVLVVGYLFGLLAMLFMRLLYWVRYATGQIDSPMYEVHIDPVAVRRFAERLRLIEKKETVTKKDETAVQREQFGILTVICHGGLLSTEMTEWFMRRWNSVVVATNCFLMLLLVILVCAITPAILLLLPRYFEWFNHSQLIGLLCSAFLTNGFWWAYTLASAVGTLSHAIFNRIEIAKVYVTLAGAILTTTTKPFTTEVTSAVAKGDVCKEPPK